MALFIYKNKIEMKWNRNIENRNIKEKKIIDN